MAKFKGYIGSTYVARSINFNDEECINLYPVRSEVETSKNIVGLQSTPGLLERYDLGSGPIRGTHEVFGRGFVVSGNKLYEIYSDYTSDEIETLITSSGTVQLSDNGIQLAMVDGRNLYKVTLDNIATTFERVISDGWRGSYSITFLDGYFNFIDPDSGIFYISSLYDAGGLNPLEFFSAEGDPDNLVGQAVLGRQLWEFGTETTEVYYNAGETDFPYRRIDGVFIQYGCAAAQSIVRSANSIFWLGRDEDGHGVVFMTNGYQPQRISTFAVEYAIQQYTDFSDAVGYTYQEDGHYFYILNFPSANATWCFDVNLNLWHKRAYFIAGNFTRHRAQNHMFVFGKHLVGDFENGKVYEQSLNIFDDNGNEIRRRRRAPHLANNESLTYIFYHRFQLDMQTGIGLTNGTFADPKVSLSWSDDGGYTWSSEHWRPAGKIGKYLTRTIWRQLGRARDRVFQTDITAACKVFLVAANIDTTLGDN